MKFLKNTWLALSSDSHSLSTHLEQILLAQGVPVSGADVASSRAEPGETEKSSLSLG